METISNSRMITPAKLLLACTSLFQFIHVIYESYSADPPVVFQALYPIAAIWLLWWWLIDDSRQRGETWPMDLGFFLAAAWMFIIPYHLFRTRGWRGMVPILMFIGAVIFGWLLAFVFVTLQLFLGP